MIIKFHSGPSASKSEKSQSLIKCLSSLFPSSLSSYLSYTYSLAAWCRTQPISSFPGRRLRLQRARALVYNVNTTPAVIDSAQEMSPLACFFFSWCLCRRMVMLAKWRRDNKSIHKVRGESSKTSSAQDQLFNFVFVYVLCVCARVRAIVSLPMCTRTSGFFGLFISAVPAESCRCCTQSPKRFKNPSEQQKHAAAFHSQTLDSSEE